MQGLMQDWPLTVDRILSHAAHWHGSRPIISREIDGLVTSDWASVAARAARLSHALKDLGVAQGDRIATLAWNRVRHIEAWYAIMGMGAVCHTLNPRLFVDQLVWIVNHAADRILIVDADLFGLVIEYLPRMRTLQHVIVMGDASIGTLSVPCHDYEQLLVGQPTSFDWGGFDENTACGLCYTSGTTGDPKGVLYSHRSNFLHAMMTLQVDAFGFGVNDVVLPIVPMFHANAWGLAFAVPAVGARMVLPGARLDGASVFELIEQEGVTFSAAVPTVWQMLLHHLRETGVRPTTLRRVGIGGSACPEGLIRAFGDEYGIEILHLWGMTELSPVGTLGALPPPIADMDFADQLPWRIRQGRAPLGVDFRLVDDEGQSVQHDGKAMGRLMVRGFAVTERYFRCSEAAVDADGWFDTGDIASIDEHGIMGITDRSKDLIKSGGEWISSVEIENVAASHGAVAIAAVVGMPHPKWDERPLLLVQMHAGASVTTEDIRDWLSGKIAHWWMPDEIRFVETIPLGATGKIDKKAIRQSLKGEQKA